MSTKDTVRIVTGTAAAKVFSPFEALGVIKTMPHRNRRWDTNEKCWVISLSLLPDLQAALAAEGFKVVIRDVHGRQPAKRERDSASWADARSPSCPSLSRNARTRPWWQSCTQTGAATPSPCRRSTPLATTRR
ncbi:hypothetical protein H0E86_03965 [Streptomyces sp. SCSIO-PteL053]|nr:hypothetical protein H0E86_03965 [Streptomyces sp. SCSIO-PteL053]